MFLAHASAVAAAASQWNYPVNELLLSANDRCCAAEHITNSGGLQQITHMENLPCSVVRGHLREGDLYLILAQLNPLDP